MLEVARPLAPLRADEVRRLDLNLDLASLEGKVVDSSGRGLDARVALVDRDDQRICCTTRTDEEGAYQILGLEGREVVPWIRAGGFAEFVGDPVPDPNEENSPLLHVLEPEARLRLEVVDDVGAPVAGATVRLDLVSRSPLLPALIDRTDVLGNSQFGALPSGAGEVSVGHDGYAPVSRRVSLVAGGDQVQPIVLERLGSILVRVHDAEGRPAAESAVTVSGTEGGEQELVTSEGGLVNVQDLVADTYQVRCGGIVESVVLRPGERREVGLRLR